MNDGELNRILSEEGDIAPSSGFASTVMEKVYQDAKDPSPIPFPWMRALPGMILCGVLMMALLIGCILFRTPAWGSSLKIQFPAIQTLNWLTGLKQEAIQWQAGWAVFALIISFITWKISMMFSTRNG